MLSRLRGVVWNTICRPGKSRSPFLCVEMRVFRVPFRPVMHAHADHPNIYRTGAGKDLLDEEEHAEQKRWESLSTKERISDWAIKHQYPLILGSWAASMGVAAAIIMRDRHQTPSQKVCKVLCPSALSENSDWLAASGRLFKLVCGRRD